MGSVADTYRSIAPASFKWPPARRTRTRSFHRLGQRTSPTFQTSERAGAKPERSHGEGG